MPASPRDLPLAADPAAGFGLYVHWPYCARICPYCDFNVHKTRAVDATAWRDAFRAEMQAMAALHEMRGYLTSIYFGGGTPSLMPPDLVAGIIADAGTIFGVAPDAEISLEANPSSSETRSFATFADAGVTRLSLGIQSFDDAALAFLGRDHSAADARAALDLAAAIFPRVTFDLIYGLPGQTLQDWAHAQRDALSRAAGHVSMYQLTIEDGTAFAAARQRGTLLPQDDDALADFYDLTQSVADEAGLPAYEVSNHAATQTERGRHNLTYWNYGAYAGIGPGAHGRLVAGGRRLATETIRAPDAWMAAVARSGHGIASREVLDEAACGTEMLLMGLRLAEGIPAGRFEAVAQMPIRSFANATGVRDLVDHGLLVVDAERIHATSDGRRVLNALVAALRDSLSW